MTDLHNRIAAAAQPTRLDRFLAWAAPEAALRRLRARATLNLATSFLSGSYDGARSDRPGLKNWNPGDGSADRDTLGDLRTLRARSRDAVRNQPIAGSVVSTKVLNVVGTGLKAKARIDRKYLGLTDEQAEEWEQMAERVFVHHSKRLDIEGELSFAEQQALALRSVLESGDLLALRRFKERKGDLLGTKIQLVEADRICNPNSRADTRQLAGGVEIDEDGVVLAYHVANGHPGDPFAWPLAWQRVQVDGAAGRRAKLLYFHLRPGQRRGVPDLAPVIEKLKQLSRLSEAELAASVLNAFFTVFIKHTADETTSSLNGYVGDSGEAENLDATGTAAPERELHLGQGTIIDLLDGEEIQTASPNRPNAAFDAFWTAMVREIGMATELPYEVLTKHFQSSYSAARAAFLMAWKAFKTYREWLSGFCTLAWEWTIEEAIARGILDAPGFFDDPLTRAAWLGVRWTGDAPGQIDELKETEAAGKRIEIGVSTEEEETIRLTGGDWEENARQREREIATRKKLGLLPTAATKPAQGAPDEDPDEADRKERQEVAA